MRNLIRFGVVSASALAFAIPASALSASSGDNEAKKDAKAAVHDLKTPLREKQDLLRAKALQMQLKGKVAQGAKVVEVAKGQFVELAREDTDRIFVIIAEFGNTRHPAFPDNPAYGATTFEGPLHNEIPEPDRALDNTTLWQPDFNRAHYENMYFNRMAKYYEGQSSGRYSVEGDVTEWVKVIFNEARYGRSGDTAGVDPAVCASIVCSNTWFLIRDAMAYWVEQQLAAGKTVPEIASYLSTFDEWDRYDYDGDGNFDEKDGYVDHFQIVHSGGDEAAGDPIYGQDAIWSHRWYTQVVPIGGGGPIVGGTLVPFGGVNAGMGGPSGGQTIPNNPTGVWVGDYTIQPENGGLGVFAHEYGHDLGLPDLYDTAGNTCGSACENSTGFWTLMSSGANIGDGGPNGIGDAPTNLGAWEKFQLGWLNFEVAFEGRKSEHKLGPLGANTKQAQGVFVVLNPLSNPSTTTLGTPTSPSNAWYSTAGDDLDVTMTRDLTLPAGSISLAMKAWYEIETCWDYAYLRVSTDGGATYTNLATNVSDSENENGQNFGNGITGISGSPKACDVAEGTPSWVDVTADLSPYAGQTVKLQVRYWTDGFVQGRGFEWDDLVITGPSVTVFSDNAEAGDNGWTLDGFRRTTGSETVYNPHFYVLEHRPYRDYDMSLKTAYNFGFLDTRPDWVEHFPYQDGLLINYWDTGQVDNSTSAHPGEGLILPVDAHPAPIFRADGAPWRARVQSQDSTFGLETTDVFTLNFLSQPSQHGGLPAVSVFDDRNSYWSSVTPTASVQVPNTGTGIRVQSVSAQGNFMQVEVTPRRR